MANKQVSTSSLNVQREAEAIAEEALHPIIAFKCILEDLGKGVNGGKNCLRMHHVVAVLDVLWDHAYEAVCKGVDRALTAGGVDHV